MAQTINLDLTPNSTEPRLHFNQYDNGRTVSFNLSDGSVSYSIPASSTVKLQGTKGSGFGFTINCTYSGSVVTAVITDDVTNEYGVFAAELSITKDGAVVGTTNFLIEVEKSPHPNGTTDGNADEVIPTLTLLVERVEAAVAKEEVLHEAEAWAVGKRDGVDVPSTDDTYHNNAKWYAEQAALSKTAAGDSEQTASEKASQAAASASDASFAQTAAEAAQTAAEAAAAAASSVFDVVGDVSFTVDPDDGHVTMWFTEEES